MSIPYLSRQILEKITFSQQEFIVGFEQQVIDSQNAKAWSAPKAVILPPDGRYIMATLAACSEPPFVATKSLVLNERNLDIGLPPINSLVTLLHGETGVPVAVIDGNWVTAVRTAGLSVVAAKYLANPDSRSIGFVGSGVQANSHLQAFARLYPLQHIKIFGRGRKNMDALSQSASALGLSYEICSTPKETVSDVDIVVSSVSHTAIKAPLIDARWLATDCFVSSVELGMAWHPDSMARFDCLVIDDLQQEALATHKLVKQQYISGDLASLITGKLSKSKTSVGTVDAFVFRGHAMGDLVLAILAYQKFCQQQDELSDKS